ncbi:MAG TPA: hypothetical protein VL475_08030, partial [Planctomycetaceae bacterium]|nr:hypothetical protein [Planctomycetaceae bacterium]
MQVFDAVDRFAVPISLRRIDASLHQHDVLFQQAFDLLVSDDQQRTAVLVVVQRIIAVFDA